MIKAIKYHLIVLLTFIVLKPAVYGQYYGGDAGGFVAGAVDYTSCSSPSQFFAYFGGSGGGFGPDNVGYTSCSTPEQFFAYFGGNGGGQSTNITTYASCGTPDQYYAYMGGNADGFSSETVNYTSCGTPPQFYAYYGGNADGFSNDSVINGHCNYPPQFYAYFGGNSDGFDTDTLTNCPVAPPVADFTASAVEICLGDTITFTDISTNYPVDWEWTFEGGTPVTSTEQNPTVSYATPGVYEVQLIATNYIGSNTVTKTAFITVHSLPVLELGSDLTFCNGNSDTLVATPGLPGYLWNDSSVNDSLIVSTAGEYYITVTDVNGCQNIDSVHVTAYDLPTVSLGNDTLACDGNTVTLIAQTGFVSYDWSNGGSIYNTLGVTTAGTYAVTVTDGNGCQASDDVVVTFLNNPVVNLGNDTTLCIGTTLLIDAGAGFSGYSWSSGETSNSINVATTGNYSVTVTDANNCYGIDTIAATFITTIFPDLGNDTAICAGNTIHFDAGSYTTYNWQDNSTLQTFDANAAGTYSVTVADSDGCIGTDNIVLTVNSLPVVSLGSDVNSCAGETVTLDADSGFTTYNWSEGTTGVSSIDVTATDTYTVTVTDGNGCENSANVLVTFNVLPVIDLGADIDTCEGNTITLDAGIGFNNYSWSTGTTGIHSINVTTSDAYYVTVSDVNNCSSVDSIIVHFNTLPVPGLGPDIDACLGDTVTVYATPGYADYSWSNGASGTDSVLISVNGAISVTITDAIGCQNTGSINVNIHNLPVVDLGNPVSACDGETVELNAGSGFTTYSWSNGITNIDSILVTISDSYSVTVTNANGCSGSDTVDVTFNSLPTVDLGSPVSVCEGETVVLNAGSGFTTYLWSNGITNIDSILVTTSDTYSVTITDANGCSGSDAVDVTFNALPVVDLGSPVSVCEGETVELNAGNGFVTYSWSNGITNIDSILVTTSDSYSVTVTDVNGCSGNDAVDVTFNTLPVIDLGADIDTCDGNTITLDAGIGFNNYSWSTGTTGIHSINVTTSDTYYVTVSDVNNCSSVDSIIVHFNTLPVPGLGSDIDACLGDTVTVHATPGYTDYLWSNGASGTDSVLISVNGTVAVTITDAIGCQNTGSINVNIYNLPVVDLGNPVSACEGETVELNAGSGFTTYSWSNGTTNIDSILVTTSDSYSVTVTNANGCSGSDTVDVTFNPLPVINLNDTVVINQADSTILDAGTDGILYVWNTGDTTQTLTVDTAGIFVVTVTNTYGCVSKDSVFVEISGVSAVANTGNGIVVYPNPNKGIFNIAFEKPGEKMTLFEILTIDGKIALQQNIHDYGVQRFDASSLPKGVYFIRITTSDNLYTAKIVVQ